MMPHRSIVIGWLMFLSTAQLARPLDPDRRISQYVHTTWRTQDGAFRGTPHAIAQTTDGYLWIGTDAGLVRFDGIRFVPWKPPQGNGLTGLSIYSLRGGSDGSLWIGSATGLARWKDDALTESSTGRGRINAIVEDRLGGVWVTRSRPRDQTGGLCRISGQSLQCSGNLKGVELIYAGPLANDALGGLWMGTPTALVGWKSGVWTSYYRGQLTRFQGLSSVQALAAGDDGNLWVGFGKSGLGLQRLVGNQPHNVVLPGVNASNLHVSALFIDRDKSLWIGTGDDGVYRFHGDRVDHFRAEDGLSSNAIETIFEDREGDIWLVTSKGVDYFRSSRVVTLSSREGLTADGVMSVLAARDGTVWLGNREGLDFVRGGRLGSIRQQDGLPGHRVTSLYEDHAGRLWVGMDRLLTVYDRGHFQRVNMPDGRSPGIVTAITEDIEQNIWAYVSDRERLLLRIHDLRVLDQFTASQIPLARVLAQDPQGGIWLGLLNGNLAHYRGARLEVIPLTHSSVDSPVMSIFVDGDNSVWAATRNGLFRWKEGRLQQLTARQCLPCDEILAIAEDTQKTLWLYAKCGAFAISRSELERWWKMPESPVRPRFVLDALDGSQPAGTSFQPAVAKSPDGRLWFVNDTIVQIIDPARLGKNALVPPVHIEALIADRKSYPIQANPRLPALTRDIELEYTAISLVIPQRVRFRYKLEERDADWQDAGTRRQAFYNDLPPGLYHFRVIGSNNDGLWNDVGATLSFSIAPAWYQRMWFRLLCVVLFLASLALFYRLRVRQIAAEMNTRFDERLAERTRLARDFHDTLLQTIQGSKMVADDALDGDADPIRMRSALGSLSTWLGRAMDEGRSALSSLRSSTIERNDLAEALRRAGEECQFQRQIEFALRVEGTGQDLHPIVRDEVYRLAYEAIRNACIHSEASQLTVELSYIKDLILRVRDNGKGIEPEVAASGKSGHFGLLGMYERASRVRGKFTIASSPGTGTEVELVVPRSFAFQEPHYTRQDRSGQLRRFFRSLLTSRKR